MKSYHKSVTEIVFVKDVIKKSDIIIIAGGSRATLAEEAYRLFKEGYADFILVTGGKNKKILNFDTECDFLCDILVEKGVPESQIIKENTSANTMENAVFSKTVLAKNNMSVKSAILVCKGFHSRRCKMTFQIHMDDQIDFCISPVLDERNITSDNWFEDDAKKEIVLSELQKIGTYFIDQLRA